MKRGTAYDWHMAGEHVLEDGEIAVETDTSKIKVGDGKTSYQLLPYVGDASVYWQTFEFKNLKDEREEIIENI
jgi:hypothetical protein